MKKKYSYVLKFAEPLLAILSKYEPEDHILKTPRIAGILIADKDSKYLLSMLGMVTEFSCDIFERYPTRNGKIFVYQHIRVRHLKLQRHQNLMNYLML